MMNASPILPPLPGRNGNSEDKVLPLINVVFLLLIFFMIAGKLIQEPPFEVTPPQTGHASAQTLQSDYLAVGPDGELAWQGEAINRNRLAQLLGQRSNSEQALQVRADLNLEAAELTGLLAELRNQGISHIQLLTRNKP